MLSFNRLGNLGRLANQMFQFAALKGIAKNRSLEWCIPPKEIFGINDHLVNNSDTNLYDCFILSELNIGILSNNKSVVESTFSFDQELFNNCDENTDLIGYFQTEKYFKHIEDEIRKDFTFKSEIFDVSREKYDMVFPHTEVISLHIRRGDYVNSSAHPVQSLEYYEKSLDLLNKNIPVIIFSDDPDWCASQELFESDRFLISETNDTKMDLCLMSFCDYHIIANSSFSWWGSWLSNSKKTIAPKKWFSGELETKDTVDLYLPNWEILDA
jgi:hypothetical protein